jgi:hypothetical protein
MKKLIATLLFVLGSAGLALAAQVSLTVGTAATNGSIAFNLVVNEHIVLPVQVTLAAGDSGAVVASKIRAAVSGGVWSAATSQRSSSTVVFYYADYQLGSIPVGAIIGVVNTASVSVLLTTTDIGPVMDLQIGVNDVASGFDASGRPSFLTFSAGGNFAPYTVLLHPGQTAKFTMDGIAKYLGAAAVRISSTEILMQVPGLANLAVSLQTYDTGLQGALALSEASDLTHGGLIDRTHCPPTCPQ